MALIVDVQLLSGSFVHSFECSMMSTARDLRVALHRFAAEESGTEVSENLQKLLKGGSKLVGSGNVLEDEQLMQDLAVDGRISIHIVAANPLCGKMFAGACAEGRPSVLIEFDQEGLSCVLSWKYVLNFYGQAGSDNFEFSGKFEAQVVLDLPRVYILQTGDARLSASNWPESIDMTKENSYALLQGVYSAQNGFQIQGWRKLCKMIPLAKLEGRYQLYERSVQAEYQLSSLDDLKLTEHKLVRERYFPIAEALSECERKAEDWDLDKKDDIDQYSDQYDFDMEMESILEKYNNCCH